MQVGLALLQQFAEGGRARRQAEAEKVQGGERRHGAAKDERQERERGDHGVGQYMAPDGRHVGYAETAGSAHIVEVARAQELRAHDGNQRHPTEHDEDDQEREHVRLEHTGEDDQHQQYRKPRPDLHEALADQVNEAAEVALRGADADADDGREGGQDDAEGHRQAEAVDKPREHVLRAVVRPEPVPCGRGGGSRALDIQIDSVVAVGNDRLDHPAPGGHYEVAHVRVGVVRLDGEFAAEFLFRRRSDDRHVQFAVHPQQDGLVIGDELRKERSAE